MICINGMAHVILTVSQFDKARAFYLRNTVERGHRLRCKADTCMVIADT